MLLQHNTIYNSSTSCIPRTWVVDDGEWLARRLYIIIYISSCYTLKYNNYSTLEARFLLPAFFFFCELSTLTYPYVLVQCNEEENVKTNIETASTHWKLAFKSHSNHRPTDARELHFPAYAQQKHSHTVHTRVYTQVVMMMKENGKACKKWTQQKELKEIATLLY